MSSVGTKILIRVGFVVLGLLIGLALGYGYGASKASATAAGQESDDSEATGENDSGGHNDHDHAVEDRDHGGEQEAVSHLSEEEDVLALTPEAAANLELKVGPAIVSDYFRELLIPGRVKENPGRSDLSVAAPFGGVISEVLVMPGQAIRPDTPLFSLRVTDEELTNAQLKLLEIITRKKVIDREMKRLEPLTESGAVTGKLRRELQYEHDQLSAQQDNRVQELRLRGLGEAQVELIVTDSKLFRETVVTPQRLFHENSPAADPDISLTVESLVVSAGAAVTRGDLLCELADHRILLIEGQAFETDLESLLKLKSSQWGITAEFGHKQHGDHTHQFAETGLRISHLSSRIDPDTQTFLFYVPIENSIVDETIDNNGVRFQTWRFVPGQQVHLRVPIERWDKQFKVPIDAVVQEGPESVIYRQHLHGEPSPGDPLEFEPVPVRVLHRDDRFAVLSPHGELKPGEPIAQNNAYQIHQAFKMQTAAGGGSHHGHQH